MYVHQREHHINSLSQAYHSLSMHSHLSRAQAPSHRHHHSTALGHHATEQGHQRQAVHKGPFKAHRSKQRTTPQATSLSASKSQRHLLRTDTAQRQARHIGQQQQEPPADRPTNGCPAHKATAAVNRLQQGQGTSTRRAAELLGRQRRTGSRCRLQRRGIRRRYESDCRAGSEVQRQSRRQRSGSRQRRHGGGSPVVNVDSKSRQPRQEGASSQQQGPNRGALRARTHGRPPTPSGGPPPPGPHQPVGHDRPNERHPHQHPPGDLLTAHRRPTARQRPPHPTATTSRHPATGDTRPAPSPAPSPRPPPAAIQHPPPSAHQPPRDLRRHRPTERPSTAAPSSRTDAVRYCAGERRPRRRDNAARRGRRDGGRATAADGGQTATRRRYRPQRAR